MYFNYLNQFLLGFRAQSYVPNIFDCANALQASAGDINRTYNFLSGDPNYLWYEYTFNVTQLISGPIADSSRDCSFATLQAVNQTVTRLLLFNSPTDYILAFL
jgi:hypothetical protein